MKERGGASSVGLVLVAAGSGSRLGSGEKKQFARLGGVPLFVRSLLSFVGTPGLARTAVVLPSEDLARGQALLEGAAPGIPAVVVTGGPTRQDSVRNGLAVLDRADVVLVHDAARPFASRSLILRTLEAASGEEGAVPALPVSDTLKRLAAGRPTTVPREDLYTAQTPQGFPREMIVEAHRRALADGVSSTDDGSLCERYGFAVRLVEGEVGNLKITTAADWEMAESLVTAREAVSRGSLGARAVRTGIGYDVHRLEEGRACVLGGVRIESRRGPVGHSDGDVLVHAIMDALLGAAGEPDIGHRFPPGDPRFAGADSLRLLGQVRDAVAVCYEILFVDSVLVAQEPRIAPHVSLMRGRVAAALGIPVERVNVKATTAEGLGAIGRAEGVAAQAVATLVERAP